MPVRNIVTITTPGLRGNGVRDARERTDYWTRLSDDARKKELNRRLVDCYVFTWLHNMNRVKKVGTLLKLNKSKYFL